MTYQQLSALLCLALIGLAYLFWKRRNEQRQAQKALQNELDELKETYNPAIELDGLIKAKEIQIQEQEKEEKDLADEYQRKKEIYDRLKGELSLVEEQRDMVSYGLYEPHYEFDTSTQYKIELGKIRDQQKALIKNKTAAVCHIQWEVGGSVREGQKMTNQTIRLMLRAFNGECDSIVGNVRWNNVVQMELRMLKSFDAINKSGESRQVDIQREYLRLKTAELRLTHEYREKLYEEKEEQKRIREAQREEERSLKEIEKAQRDAEKEEIRFEKALEKARQEIATAQGEKLDKLNDQIAGLEAQLQAAHEARERAKSRAELTKSGHVYVISNIGSFGEGVYKIGLTRRLEPLDRVSELGDASVPFLFDVHALIYAENAPELENRLHKAFEDRRVNLANSRKEFFRVSLEEIERIVHENFAQIEFTRAAEAKEYRETLAIRTTQEKAEEVDTAEEELFPANLN